MLIEAMRSSSSPSDAAAGHGVGRFKERRPVIGSGPDVPRGFGVKRVMDLPMAWSDQWSALGLKPPAQA